jgi:glutathione S-transferase
MKLRLISFALCPFVHRSTTLLHEKGIDFQLDHIDLEDKPEWFKILSPRGKVPLLLVDDSRPIFESAVINEFIDETHSPRLLPDEPLARAQQRAWVEVANDLFLADYKVVFGSQTKDEYDAARHQLDAVLQRFEEQLWAGKVGPGDGAESGAESERKNSSGKVAREVGGAGTFFSGDAFGLVDAAVAPAFYRLLLIEDKKGLRIIDPTRFPKVRDWARRLASRPSVIKGVRSDFEREYFAHIVKRGSYFAREWLAPRTNVSSSEAGQSLAPY